MTTILSAHQPAYLAYLGQYHKIAVSDIFIISDDLRHAPRTYPIRNKIRDGEGWKWITIPVSKEYHGLPSFRVKPNPELDWQTSHWESIKRAYSDTPYFPSYEDEFKEFYSRSWRDIVEIDVGFMQWMCRLLGIDTELHLASSLGISGKGVARHIQMCELMGADIFVYGVDGKKYATQEQFDSVGTRLYFQNYTHPVYSQGSHQFIPYMSVIDLLFNEGDRSLDIILSGNDCREDIIRRSRTMPISTV